MEDPNATASKSKHTPGPWNEVGHFVDISDSHFEPTEQGVYEVVRANEDINTLRRDGQDI